MPAAAICSSPPETPNAQRPGAATTVTAGLSIKPTKDAAALADHDGNFRTDRLVSSIVKRETRLK
jgi:hypothetical protein